MVRGIGRFKEYFMEYDGNYVLIGGAACNLIEEENLLVPRATKDLDVILVVEALTDEFVVRFWEFVKDAGYQHRQKGSEKSEFYRFMSPKDAAFPSQIELLSRKPDMINVPEGITVGPIPTGEELSSLSAIMLNDAYYNYTIENCLVVNDVHIAAPQALICLKAKAYLNLKQSRMEGNHVNSTDITKHKNDVIRLAVTIPASSRFLLPDEIKADLSLFYTSVREDLPQDDFMRRIGAPGLTVAQVMEHIHQMFDL